MRRRRFVRKRFGCAVYGGKKFCGDSADVDLALFRFQNLRVEIREQFAFCTRFEQIFDFFAELVGKVVVATAGQKFDVGHVADFSVVVFEFVHSEQRFFIAAIYVFCGGKFARNAAIRPRFKIFLHQFERFAYGNRNSVLSAVRVVDQRYDRSVRKHRALRLEIFPHYPVHEPFRTRRRAARRLHYHYAEKSVLGGRFGKPRPRKQFFALSGGGVVCPRSAESEFGKRKFAL